MKEEVDDEYKHDKQGVDEHGVEHVLKEIGNPLWRLLQDVIHLEMALKQR